MNGRPSDRQTSQHPTTHQDGERERVGLPRIETPVPEVLRYRISLETLRVEERVMPGIACEAPEVNPAVRGRPYRYGYASARTDKDVRIDPGAYIWFGGLGKLDFEQNQAEVWGPRPAAAVRLPHSYLTPSVREKTPAFCCRGFKIPSKAVRPSRSSTRKILGAVPSLGPTSQIYSAPSATRASSKLSEPGCATFSSRVRVT